MTEKDQKKSPHYSVLLNEILDNLDIQQGKNYLDCTFGAGGYSKAILNRAECNLTALDQDPNVSVYVDQVKQDFGNRFEFVKTNFSDAINVLDKKFDGIVLDLGVSSMQIDQGERGFSFMKDGPLDMRMSGQGISAEDYVNEASEEDIANVIYKYGEEVKSRRIAKKIVEYRSQERIKTTGQLAAIIKQVIPHSYGKIDPATKTFQAIRIFINQELSALENFLYNVRELLNPAGRLLVVSFHSLEDSIVKNFFRDNSAKKIARSKYARDILPVDPDKWLQVITKKPIVPTREEVKINPRSRSAKLRVAQKMFLDDKNLMGKM